MDNFDAKSFRPTWNYVLVEKEKPSEKIGRFFLPEVSQPEPWIAKVIAKGPGYPTDEGVFLECDLKIGGRYLVNRFAGYKMTIAGREFTVVQWFPNWKSDIWAEVENDFDDVAAPLPGVNPLEANPHSGIS